jgi:CBS domain-containing protein
MAEFGEHNTITVAEPSGAATWHYVVANIKAVGRILQRSAISAFGGKADDGKIVGIVSVGDIVKSIIDDQKFMIEELEGYIHGHPAHH